MANKVKTMWYCSECGADSPKWVGRCPSCGQWGTMVEERVSAKVSKGSSSRKEVRSKPQKVSEIQTLNEPRIHMPSEELNRVLGGGLVAGSLVLIGGEPGIGKSTLVLQNILSIKTKTILYVSGEESASQLKLRADRIGRLSDNCYIVCETSLDSIFDHIEEVQPQIVIVDSIQTIASDAIESSAGSVIFVTIGDVGVEGRWGGVLKVCRYHHSCSHSLTLGQLHYRLHGGLVGECA